MEILVQVGLLEIVFITNILDYIGKKHEYFIHEWTIWIIALLFTGSSLWAWSRELLNIVNWH